MLRIAVAVGAITCFVAPLPAVATDLMEEIVLTATRTEKTVRVSPYSVGLITRQALGRESHDQLADTIGQLPGIQVSDAGQAGQKRVRIRGEEARRTALLIDGQEFVDHREVGVPLLVDASRIERIEVVRGAASVLYGPRALGGVINVITRQETDRTVSGALDATYNGGTNGYQSGFHLAGSGSRNLVWTAGAFVNDQSLRRTPFGDVENTDYRASGGHASLGLRLDQHELTLGYEDFRSASNVYVEPEIRFTPPFIDFRIESPQRDRSKVRIDYTFIPSGSQLSSVQLDLYRQQSERQFDTYPTLMLGPGVVSATTILTDSELQSDGANVQLDWFQGEALSLIAGMQWTRDDIHQVRDRSVAINGLATTHEQVLDSGDVTTTALYAQSDWSVTPNTSLITGVRAYDIRGGLRQSSRPAAGQTFASNEVVTSLALVTITGFGTFRANVSEGYIYPSLLNLVVGAYAGSSFIHPVADLVPETSNTFEVGYRAETEYGNVDASVFVTRAKNYVDHEPCSVLDNCPGRRDRIYRNVGSADTEGLELQWNLPVQASQLQSSFTWLRRKKNYDGVNTRDSGLPAFSGRVSLRTPMHFRNIPMSTAVTMRFESGSRELIATRSGFDYEHHAGYGVLDADWSVSLSESVRVALTAANLTDRTYRSATENLAAPGRHLRLKLSAGF